MSESKDINKLEVDQIDIDDPEKGTTSQSDTIKSKIVKYKLPLIGGGIALIVIIIIIAVVASGGKSDDSDLTDEQLELTCVPQQQLKEFYIDYVLDSTPKAQGTLTGTQVLEEGITESIGDFTIVVKKDEAQNWYFKDGEYNH